VKFADADLLGVPLRLLVSEKTLAADAVEWKERAEDETDRVPMVEVSERVVSWLAK
jgi:prolyl-tRNA synthetase